MNGKGLNRSISITKKIRVNIGREPEIRTQGWGRKGGKFLGELLFKVASTRVLGRTLGRMGHDRSALTVFFSSGGPDSDFANKRGGQTNESEEE